MNIKTHISFWLIIAITWFSTPQLRAEKNIFIPRFNSNATNEYQWIGIGIAKALQNRVQEDSQLNCFSLRQIEAALEADNIDPQKLHIPTTSSQLGLLLGADYSIIGSYNAIWPHINLVVHIIDIKAQKAIATFEIKSTLDQLLHVEQEIAKKLSTLTIFKKIPTTNNYIGTTNLLAWRHVVLGQAILMNQSLSPLNYKVVPPEAMQTAKQHFQAAIDIDSKCAQAYTELAISNSLMGMYSHASQNIAKAKTYSKKDSQDVVTAEFVNIWFQSKTMKNDDVMLKKLSDLTHRATKNLLVQGYYGEALVAKKKYKEAIKHFNQIKDQNNKQPWVYAQIGYSYSKLKDFKKAIATTITAVDLSPQSPYLLLQLASRYIDAQKFSGAEDVLKQAIDKFPEFPTAYVRLGYIYLLKNKITMAIAISEKALLLAQDARLKKDRAYAHLNLSRAYFLKKNQPKAIENFKQALENGLADISVLKNDKQFHDFLEIKEVKRLLQNLK